MDILFCMVISVVMNTYNENPVYLKQAIESYLNQVGVEVELIVSTLEDDNNLGLIRSYPVKVVFTKKDNHPGKSAEGSYTQINNALYLCTGKYFCFASSNDWADENKLKNESDALESTGKKVCYSDFYLTREDGTIFDQYNFAEYDYSRHKFSNFIHDCSMVDMELLRKYTPFDLSKGNFAFWDLWLKIAKKEDRGEVSSIFHYLRYPTWYYRKGLVSLSSKRMSNDDKIQYNLDKERFINTHHR